MEEWVPVLSSRAELISPLTWPRSGTQRDPATPGINDLHRKGGALRGWTTPVPSVPTCRQPCLLAPVSPLLLWPRGEQCGGCRRSNTTDRPHAFQVILADRPCLELSAESEAEMADWMQHLCQAVSKGVSTSWPTTHLPDPTQNSRGYPEPTQVTEQPKRA